MWREYAPEPRARLNLGIRSVIAICTVPLVDFWNRRRLASLLDNDQRKIRLAHSILFTMPGSPILYYGDEIGMGDNIYLKVCLASFPGVTPSCDFPGS